MNPVKQQQRFLKSFWMRVDKSRGCWVWMGAKDNCGYGVVYRDGKNQQCHRVSKELSLNRPLVPATKKLTGELVLHTCDTPACVNPDHLVLGTQADNIKDRDQKRRTSLGESRPAAKLTDEKVLRLRRLYKRKKKTILELSTMFRISYATTWCVVREKSWRHLL